VRSKIVVDFGLVVLSLYGVMVLVAVSQDQTVAWVELVTAISALMCFMMFAIFLIAFLGDLTMIGERSGKVSEVKL